jgi:hypothetical protein
MKLARLCLFGNITAMICVLSRPRDFGVGDLFDAGLECVF